MAVRFYKPCSAPDIHRMMDFIIKSLYGFLLASVGACTLLFFDDPVYQATGVIFAVLTLLWSWATYGYLVKRHKPLAPGGQAYTLVPSAVVEA